VQILGSCTPTARSCTDSARTGANTVLVWQNSFTSMQMSGASASRSAVSPFGICAMVGAWLRLLVAWLYPAGGTETHRKHISERATLPWPAAAAHWLPPVSHLHIAQPMQ
jgi:hypothetical protein